MIPCINFYLLLNLLLGLVLVIVKLKAHKHATLTQVSKKKLANLADSDSINKDKLSGSAPINNNKHSGST